MKRFTLSEAIKEISNTMPFKVEDLYSISYANVLNNKYHFHIMLIDGSGWFINLDDSTYSSVR